MKVTKLIREYVEEQVSKVYDTKVNPYTQQADNDRQKLKAFEVKLRNQQRETINKFLSENELFEDNWCSGGFRKVECNTNIPCFSHYKTQSIINEKKWIEENKRAKNAKVREIIVSLELGATKQELNDMIAKLMEE